MLTAKQIEMRRTVVGSSEIGALVDYYAPREDRVDPYKTALQVFTEKVQPAPRGTEEDHRSWGLDLEPAILAHHCRRMGYRMLDAPGTLLHDAHPLCATPDALVSPAAERRIRNVQVKNDQGWGQLRWGEPGTDDAPLLYVAQVTVELGVLRASRYAADLDTTADLAVSMRGAPPVAFHITYDDDLFRALAELAARFKREHIDTGKPPPLDGSDTAAEYVRRRYPRPVDDRMLVADDTAAALVQAVATLRATCGASAAELAAAENQLKALIGDASGIDGLCTWKKNKDTTATVTDWEAVARRAGENVEPNYLQSIIALHTKQIVTREGARQLRLINTKSKKG